MAAIDPSAAPEHTGTVNGDTKSRATLKLIYDANPEPDSDSDEGSDEEEEYLKALLAGRESEDEDEDEEDESSSDDEEKNGGPSDPSKSKRARKEAAVMAMMKAIAEGQDASEDEMSVDESPKVNGLSKKSNETKGKGKAVAEDLEVDLGEDDTEDSMDGMEEVVVCTLDPEKVGECPDFLSLVWTTCLPCLFRTASRLLT